MVDERMEFCFKLSRVDWWLSTTYFRSRKGRKLNGRKWRRGREGGGTGPGKREREELGKGVKMMWIGDLKSRFVSEGNGRGKKTLEWPNTNVARNPIITMTTTTKKTYSKSQSIDWSIATLPRLYLYRENFHLRNQMLKRGVETVPVIQERVCGRRIKVGGGSASLR